MTQWRCLCLMILAAATIIAQKATGGKQTGDTHIVLPGIEVLLRNYPGELAGKRVGILTNPTGVDLNFISTIDRIRGLPEVKVVKLFAPEHGVRGGYGAGENIKSQRDSVSGLPVISLHGENRRVPPEALEGLDVVVYDIQDIGARSYTFVSTLTYMMEACEVAGVEVLVLDRPEPLGGNCVGGPPLDRKNISFIGVHSVPSTYGLTPGEWAMLMKQERTPKLKLKIIRMEGWRRGMTYGETGLAWVPPSEHIPRWETSLFYAMTGDIGELQTINNGVGTPLPFEQFGAPGLDGAKLAAALEKKKLSGVRFRATTFKPRYGTFTGQFCNGVQIHLLDERACDPNKVALAIMEQMNKLFPEKKFFTARAGAEDYQMFIKALGDSALATALAQKSDLAASKAKCEEEATKFRARCKPILLYQ